MTTEEKDKKIILGLVLSIILLITIILLLSCSIDSKRAKDKNKKEIEKPTIIDKKGKEESDDILYYPIYSKVDNDNNIKQLTNIQKTEQKVIKKSTSFITQIKLNNVLQLLEQAELTLTQEDYTNAKNAVNEIINILPDNTIKEELINRIDYLEKLIYIDTTVMNLETELTQANSKENIITLRDKLIDLNISEKISDLKEGDKKSYYQGRIELLESIVFDETAPVIKKPLDKASYNKKVNISITDENIYFAYLNGKELEKNNITTEGKYTLRVVDIAFNETIITFTIDKTAPTLSLNGEETINLTKGIDLTYNELGAISTDNFDGTSTITNPTISYYNDLGNQEIVNYVDTNKIGRYDLTYTSTDKAGNTSTIVRTVNVKEAERPTASYSLYLSLDNNKLEKVNMDTYNLTLNDAKIINIKSVLNDIQYSNNAKVIYTITTMTDTYTLDNINEDNLTIDLKNYPTLQKIDVNVDGEIKTIIITDNQQKLIPKKEVYTPVVKNKTETVKTITKEEILEEEPILETEEPQQEETTELIENL